MINGRRKRTKAKIATTTKSSVSLGTTVYAEFLVDELSAQDARKASFEQRGLAVVTTAGTLVTLLFGLAALSTTVTKSQELPADAKKWLAIALVLFVVSAIFALLTNFPIPYQAVPADDIEARLREKPTVRDKEAAHRDIALTQIKVLRDAKKKNSVKGWLLFVALSFEVVAVGFVCVTIFEVIHP